MLGKLVKYDLKASGKLFLLIHIIYLLTCLMVRFFYVNQLDFEAPAAPLFTSIVIASALMLFIITAVCICTWLQITFRFYRNLFGKEGYLTWTLPASSTEHLWAKLLSGYLLSAANTVIIAIGILILVTGENVTAFYAQFAPTFTAELGVPLTTYALWLFLYSLVGGICSVIWIYFCITAGQLFPGHRVLCAIAVYFIFGFVIQALSFLILFLSGYFPGYNHMASQGITAAAYLTGTLLISTVLIVIITVLQYAAMHYIMKRQINLL